MPEAHLPAAVRPALSLQPPNFAAKDPGIGGWRHLFEQARGADAAGIDRLVVSDHVVLGETLEVYGDPKAGGTKGGVQPTGPDGQWLDPIVLLSMWAAITKRTRFLTGILIAPLRRPATLAKQLSTLDVLSEGRLDIGVGVGWQREEYEANGIEYDGRGKLLDETLEICQTLWRNESASHQGKLARFERVHVNPKPVHPCGVPFWISGTLNPNVLRRIVKYGSGWIPWGPDGMNPIEGLKKIREELVKAGRSAEGFEATSYIQVAYTTESNGASKKIDVEKTMAHVPAMVAGGLTDLRITLDLPSSQAAVEDLLTPLVKAFRQAAGRR
jgi:probable F420-dependent oxidoreductase